MVLLAESLRCLRRSIVKLEFQTLTANHPATTTERKMDVVVELLTPLTVTVQQVHNGTAGVAFGAAKQRRRKFKVTAGITAISFGPCGHRFDQRNIFCLVITTPQRHGKHRTQQRRERHALLLTPVFQLLALVLCQNQFPHHQTTGLASTHTQGFNLTELILPARHHGRGITDGTTGSDKSFIRSN